MVKGGELMAEIFILNVSDCEEELLKLLPEISKERLAKTEKNKNAQARLLSVASEVILAFSLSETLPITYKTDKNGKPFIPTLPLFQYHPFGKFSRMRRFKQAGRTRY